MSNIEWTEKTWNPTVGCTEVSRGCRECYAARMAWRHMHNPKTNHEYAGTAKKLLNGRIVFTGKINMLPDRLLIPLQTKKPTTWFVDSMSDLFHEDIPFSFIYDVFRVMDRTPYHIYQVLTKRPQRMLEFVMDYAEIKEPLSHVWLGTSVEDQKAADKRISPLKELADLDWLTWVSNEPCVGKIDWTGWEFIRWMVTGGESGNKADPMHPDWARGARDFCSENNIPFFFKQWGTWVPSYIDNGNLIWMGNEGNYTDKEPHMYSQFGRNVSKMEKGTKRDNGRMLDGHLHDNYPKVIRKS